MNSWLPPAIELEHVDGCPDRYLEALYRVFHRDFISSKPIFQGKEIKNNKYPTCPKGRHETFWHIVTGEYHNVEDRVLKTHRAKTVPWIRPIIEGVQENKTIYWKNKRNNDTHIVISLKDFSYIVVLDERIDRKYGNGTYLVLTSAYPVEYSSRRRKLEIEYQRYIASIKD